MNQVKPLKFNNWNIALTLCLIAFLGYRAIETGRCVEFNLESLVRVLVGACREDLTTD